MGAKEGRVFMRRGEDIKILEKADPYFK